MEKCHHKPPSIIVKASGIASVRPNKFVAVLELSANGRTAESAKEAALNKVMQVRAQTLLVESSYIMDVNISFQSKLGSNGVFTAVAGMNITKYSELELMQSIASVSQFHTMRICYLAVFFTNTVEVYAKASASAVFNSNYIAEAIFKKMSVKPGKLVRVLSHSAMEESELKKVFIVSDPISEFQMPRDIEFEVVSKIEAEYEFDPCIRDREAPIYALSGNMEKMTLDNTNYRHVVFTTKQMQFVEMSLEPGEDVPAEIHEHITQFVRVEAGMAKVEVDGVTRILSKDEFVIIPSGSKHRISQMGEDSLKLYTLYASGDGRFEHPVDQVQTRQPAE